jgi:hypothetical protein
VIDPLVAYLSSEVNSNNDHSVRRALVGLKPLAERTGCAVLGVRHLNKARGASPLHRGSGSTAFINFARVGLIVGHDPDDESEQRRVLAVNKVNTGAHEAALAYRIEPFRVPRDERGADLLETARVVWEGPSHHTARTILAEPEDEDERGAGQIAQDMLRQLLLAGPWPEQDIRRELEQAGVSRRTYFRARAALKATAAKTGFGKSGAWLLSLPVRPAPPTPPTASSGAGGDASEAEGVTPAPALVSVPAKSATSRAAPPTTTPGTLSPSGAPPGGETPERDRGTATEAPKGATPVNGTLDLGDAETTAPPVEQTDAVPAPARREVRFV